jgi:thymidylate synthase
MQKVYDIRKKFIEKLKNKDFVIDKTGVKTVELLAESFIADEPAIFGTVNEDYLKREISWYESQSLYIKDIPGGPPQVWQQVASKEGKINSNYGWCIFSKENYNQYENVKNELIKNGESTRRAEMIYTRPSMWIDYNYNGMSDFMCTDAVQYFIRDNKLHAHVRMRSQDVVFGYKNDYGWQKYVLEKLVNDLNNSKLLVKMGNIYWTVGSLHVYERHFNLIK